MKKKPEHRERSVPPHQDPDFEKLCELASKLPSDRFRALNEYMAEQCEKEEADE